MQIVSNHSLKTSFFITNIDNCGEPIWNIPSKNTFFSIVSENPELDFLKVSTAYHSGAFDIFKQGQNQPFVTRANMIEVLECCMKIDRKKIHTLARLQKVIDKNETRLANITKLITLHQHLILFK